MNEKSKTMGDRSCTVSPSAKTHLGDKRVCVYGIVRRFSLRVNEYFKRSQELTKSLFGKWNLTDYRFHTRKESWWNIKWNDNIAQKHNTMPPFKSRITFCILPARIYTHTAWYIWSWRTPFLITVKRILSHNNPLCLSSVSLPGI